MHRVHLLPGLVVVDAEDFPLGRLDVVPIELFMVFVEVHLL
jgi:hypothetical protein